MSYSMRNTILLLLLSAVIFSVGEYIVNYSAKKKLNNATLRLAGSRKELEEMRTYNMDYDWIKTQMVSAQELWTTHPKRINNTENSVVSYEYFNTLASFPDSKISFNFRKNEINDKGYKRIRTNTYILSGESSFVKLYKFLWKLERFSPLYTVEELEIEQVNGTAGAGDTVKFYISIKGYSTDEIDNSKKVSARSSGAAEPARNPFRALLWNSLPVNTGNLPEVDGSVLLGLSNNNAVLKDQNGKIWSLKEGDAVYLGILSGIDQKNQRAVFSLNMGGIMKTAYLDIQFKHK